MQPTLLLKLRKLQPTPLLLRLTLLQPPVPTLLQLQPTPLLALRLLLRTLLAPLRLLQPTLLLLLRTLPRRCNLRRRRIQNWARGDFLARPFLCVLSAKRPGVKRGCLGGRQKFSERAALNMTQIARSIVFCYRFVFSDASSGCV